MGGEKRAATQSIVQMFGHTPGNGESIESGGATANLIKDDQTAIGGIIENGSGLVHFHHEGGLPLGKIIAGPDTGEDAIDEADFRLRGGQITADLCHENEQGRLPDVGAFARHVGAGENDETVALRFEQGVVGYEFFFN